VGRRGALPRLLAELGAEGLHAYSLDLANRFRVGIGLDASDSAIVSLRVGPDAAESLARAGIAASLRAERLRLSFHICLDAVAVDHAISVLRPHVQPPVSPAARRGTP
jgi:hypothetical protein